MKLTGKCKEAFEKWHREQTPEMGHWYSIINFNNLPDSMKYGVYVDFFMEYNIFIDIQPFFEYNEESYTSISRWVPRIIMLNEKIEDEEDTEFINFDLAKKESVLKSNKKYNENY